MVKEVEGMAKGDRFVRHVGDNGGGSLIGYVLMSYADLVKVFGKPNGYSGDKVSTSWMIEDTVTGNVFEIYDYKETNLYERGMQSVAGFRKRPSYDWHLGGTKLHKQALSRFLNEKLGQVGIYARGVGY